MATKKKRSAVSSAKLTKAKGTTKKGEKKSPVDLDAIARAVEGKKGSGIRVLRFVDDDVTGHVSRVLCTGVLAIDRATGIGGLPSGRLVECYGQEDTGKTTATDHIIAATQQQGGVAAVVDTEEKKDVNYARKIGVKVDELLVIQPERKTFEATTTAVLNLLDHWVKNNLHQTPLTIVWDSIAGTPMESELPDGEKEVKPAEAAKFLSGFMRPLMAMLGKAKAHLVVVNQQYEQIGGFSPKPGVRRKTYGGKAIRYHATMRFEFIRTGQLKGPGGQVLGIEGIVKPFKNNLGPPTEGVEYGIMYGVGFDNMHSVFTRLKDFGVIKSGGGFYHFAHQLPDGTLVHDRWQGGHLGLGQMVANSPSLFASLVDAYQKL